LFFGVVFDGGGGGGGFVGWFRWPGPEVLWQTRQSLSQPRQLHEHSEAWLCAASTFEVLIL
jgi:hypothetical protein